jgi:hypothetical protein
MVFLAFNTSMVKNGREASTYTISSASATLPVRCCQIKIRTRTPREWDRGKSLSIVIDPRPGDVASHRQHGWNSGFAHFICISSPQSLGLLKMKLTGLKLMRPVGCREEN